jgi:lysophospholipase L1-like esterase
MNPTLVIALILTVLSQPGFGQRNIPYKIWLPSSDTLHVLEGCAWPDEVENFYDRLPLKAKATVRKDVWDLSKHTAGLQIRFQTNAPEIVIRYTVGGVLQMHHMPATGVSGLDLYSKSIDGIWHWAAGKFNFGDTVTFRYSQLVTQDQHVKTREYTLYLPLYNSVKWMEISIPDESIFKPITVRAGKPIVVYGTSIAQGGCASRPGLAWTNILGRKLDRTVINLGFSGNGRMENELLDLLVEVDAGIYVLDCLPNMVGASYPGTLLRKKLIDGITRLQQKRKGVPILLAEHDGYTDESLNQRRKKDYTDANIALKEVYDSLIKAGNKDLYLLTKEAINQDIETMVDGTHPNDIGMMRYATAYEKKITEILNEPAGNVTTMKPITQRRDANIYDWETRHNEILEYTQKFPPNLVFIGNSITHFWGGLPKGPIQNGNDSWEKYFGPKQAINMGFGWDRIENVLWRVFHGELDHIAPDHIVLMIGTNNLEFNTNEEIVLGIQHLIKAIQVKQPNAALLIMGIFPRKKFEERIATLNKSISKLSAGPKMRFADAGKLLSIKGGKINESLFLDGLHPNASGYDAIGEFITRQLSLF